MAKPRLRSLAALALLVLLAATAFAVVGAERPTAAATSDVLAAPAPQSTSSSSCAEDCWSGYSFCQLLCQYDPQTGSCEWQCDIQYNGCVQECIDIPDRP